ncbi:MAG: zf-TFIIB domain-containing protein [Phycisphaerae bacterium]|nr:zf-TFIIB domain-containing protein [Phycisphaerae bacterium]
MNCPRCENVEMGRETVEGVEIDRCPTCQGIWLDAHELEKLVAAPPRELLREDRHFAPHADAGEAQLSCPRCTGSRLIKLNSRLRPGTIIDSCTVCYGNWLDAGELTRLTGAGLAGRLRKLFGA